MKKWFHARKKKMSAYGKNLEWIERKQYGDEFHTGMASPNSGRAKGKRRKRYLRSFKKAERMRAKEDIRRETCG